MNRYIIQLAQEFVTCFFIDITTTILARIGSNRRSPNSYLTSDQKQPLYRCEAKYFNGALGKTVIFKDLSVTTYSVDTWEVFTKRFLDRFNLFFEKDTLRKDILDTKVRRSEGFKTQVAAKSMNDCLFKLCYDSASSDEEENITTTGAQCMEDGSDSDEEGVQILNELTISSIYLLSTPTEEQNMVNNYNFNPTSLFQINNMEHRVLSSVNDPLTFDVNEESSAPKTLDYFRAYMLEVEVEEHRIYGLLDTGAFRSFMDAGLFTTMKETYPDRIKSVIRVQPIDVGIAISKKSFRADTSIVFECRIGGINFDLSALIMPNLTNGLVIGRDFFLRHVRSIHLEKKELEMKETNNNIPYLSCICHTVDVHIGHEDKFDEAVIYKGGPKILIERKSEEEIDRILNGLTSEQDKVLRDLISQFPQVFSTDGRIGLCNKYVHKFKLKDDFTLLGRPFVVTKKDFPAVKAEVDKWLEIGTIRPSSSPHRVPLVIVKKANGKVRPCGDFREFNRHLLAQNNQVPRIEELRLQYSGCKYFTTLDFNSGFLQIQLHEESIPYCAFVFNSQAYEWTRVPFGTADSMSAFVGAMNIVLRDMDTFCKAYVDDLIIYSRTYKDHLQHIQQVLTRIGEADMTVAEDKCNWAQPHVKFLGFIISEKGVEPNPEKVASIRSYPVPKCKREFLSFLGMINYFRSFIPRCAEISKILIEISKANVKFKWTEEAQKAFEELKNILANAILQSHPDFDKPFYLFTDASIKGIAGIIYQIVDEDLMQLCPVACASRVLNKAEENYPIYELEFLAVIFTLKKYYYMLAGANIYLHTDNVVIKFLRLHPELSKRMQRWLIYFNQFNIYVQHIKGNTNVVADALSRFHQIYLGKEKYEVLYFGQVVTDKVRDELNWLCKYQTEDETLQDRIRKFPNEYSTNTKGVIMRRIRGEYKICIPEPLVNRVIEHYHLYFGHIGAVKLLHQLQAIYTWPGMYRTISVYVIRCELCNLCKPNRKKVLKIYANTYRTEVNDRVAVDAFGPLPKTDDGYSYIIVIMDIFSRYTRLVPVKEISAKTSIKAVNKYIVDVGTPKSIISDNARNFDCAEWRDHWSQKNIQVHYACPYFAGANPVERVMATISETLRVYLLGVEHWEWKNWIQDVQDKINWTQHSVTRKEPALLMGKKRQYDRFAAYCGYKDKGTILLENHIAEARRNQQIYVNRLKRVWKRYNFDEVKLQVGDEVYIKRVVLSEKGAGVSKKLSNVYSGPYLIHAPLFDNSYLLLDPDTNKVLKKLQNIRNLKYSYQRLPSCLTSRRDE